MNALPYLIFPACALVAVLIIAAIQRGRPLDDRSLLMAFGGLFSLAFLLCFALLRSQWAQATLDPAAKLVTDLQAHPLMRALGDYHLDEDHAWRGAIAKEVANGRTVAEALDLARPALALMGRDRLGFADEDAHLAWADAELTALKELRQIEVSQCATLARNVGEKTGFLVLGPGMSASYAQKFEQAFLQVLSSADAGMRHEGKPPSAKIELDQMQQRYRQLRDSWVQSFGEAPVDYLERKRFDALPPYTDNRGLCDLRISQLESMLAQPPAMAARLLDAAMR